MPVKVSGGEVTSLSLVGVGEIPKQMTISSSSVQVLNID